MAFETLKPSGGRAGANEPVISLRKSGGIGITQPALDKFFEDAEYIKIDYDDEENLLRLTPQEEDTTENYKLTRSDSGGSVTPKSPMRQHGLIPDITTRYEPSWNGNNSAAVIDLDEDKIGTYGSPREEDEGGGSSSEAEGEEEALNVE